MSTRAEISDAIRALENTEVHVETNDGTYSAAEAQRKVRSGDPRYATRNVYETVGGKRRATGPDAADAPGRMRHLNTEQMRELRAKLSALQSDLAKAK